MRQPPSIDAIGGGGFRVAGQRYEGSLLILDDVALPWDARRVDILTPADFQAVFDAPPGAAEFVLLGTGATQSLPPRAVREAMVAAGLGFEFMATHAAAKTYNFLASEGRRLACCLIAV